MNARQNEANISAVENSNILSTLSWNICEASVLKTPRQREYSGQGALGSRQAVRSASRLENSSEIPAVFSLNLPVGLHLESRSRIEVLRVLTVFEEMHPGSAK